jgi:hypothetical protein
MFNAVSRILLYLFSFFDGRSEDYRYVNCAAPVKIRYVIIIVIVITIRSNWFLSLYSGQIVIVITIRSNWFLSLYSGQIVIVITIRSNWCYF